MTAVVVVLGTGLGACGDDDQEATASPAEPHAALEGLTRDDPLDVSAVTVPEVWPGRDPEPFELRAAEGELLYVYFGYTSCPDVCPLTLSDLRGALDQLDEEDATRLSVGFVTVDPERDTPEVLVGYLGHFFERTHALRTEDPDQLRAVEEAFGASSSITPQPSGGYEVSHTAISYVVDSDGRVVVEWPYGTPSDAMAQDLQILFDTTPDPEERPS